MEYTVNQQTIQKYAERLTNDLCRQFFVNKAFISGPEILTFNVENQLNLLIVKNIFLNWQKETLKLKSPYFDFEDETVKQALKTFMNKLSNHIKVYRYDFEPIVTRSIQDLILLSAAPADFFKKEIEALSSPKIQIGLLKEFAKYIKINRFILDQVIREIEATGLTETFGGETFRFILKAINENPDKLEHPEKALANILEQLPAQVTEFVCQPKPLVTKPAFLEERKPEVTEEKPKSNFAVIEPPALVAFETEVPAEEQNLTLSEQQTALEQIENQQLEKAGHEAITDEESSVFADSPLDTFDSVAEKVEPEPMLTDAVAKAPEVEVMAHEPLRLNETLKAADDRITVAEAIKTKATQAPFKTLVPMHYRFTFINSLFGGNQADWARAVELIDGTTNLEDAVSGLKSTFAEQYKWDQQEDNVAILINYIERKF